MITLRLSVQHASFAYGFAPLRSSDNYRSAVQEILNVEQKGYTTKEPEPFEGEVSQSNLG